MSMRPLLLALTAFAAAACVGTRAPREVLVAGASGQTGQQIVKHLRLGGYHVRALVRDPAQAQPLLGDDVEYVRGDVREPATLPAAMSGVDAVISSVGARSKDGPDRPETIDYQGVRNLVDAARTARVRQFVLISSRGVTDAANPLNRMFGEVLIWKLKGEDYLRQSGLAYTVVRPGLLLNEPGGQADLVFEQGDRRTDAQRLIPREDVAIVCVEALKHPEAKFRTFEVYRAEGAPVGDWKAKFASLEPDPES